jgi:hypothetical protein
MNSNPIPTILCRFVMKPLVPLRWQCLALKLLAAAALLKRELKTKHKNSITQP